MSKITYTDKEYIYENAEIPEINKVTYNNMNDIKKAINQSTNYNATTEDGTGKIKCTLTGTLASGDIVNITIPTLANTSAKMQLSVDNGAHYYYIKQMSDDAVLNDYSNTELSASKCTLYFDGTQFILDKSKYGCKVINNLTTATAGNGVLDAYQGKVLNDKINNLDTYSTTETDTGEIWIDGKPIYRKVITGIHNDADILISNVDTLIKAYGQGDNITSQIRIIPWVEIYDGKNFTITVYKTGNDVCLKSQAENIAKPTTSTTQIVIEYTKTTD